MEEAWKRRTVGGNSASHRSDAAHRSHTDALPRSNLATTPGSADAKVAKAAARPGAAHGGRRDVDVWWGRWLEEMVALGGV